MLTTMAGISLVVFVWLCGLQLAVSHSSDTKESEGRALPHAHALAAYRREQTASIRLLGGSKPFEDTRDKRETIWRNVLLTKQSTASDRTCAVEMTTGFISVAVYKITIL